MIINKEQIKELLTRGVENVIELEHLKNRLLAGEKLRVKFGIDPTASEIHLGNAIALRKLKEFQDLGHQVIFLIGDFTAKIGDPSSRDSTRPILSDKEIDANMATYKKQVAKILDLKKIEVRYNSEWWKKMNFIEVLKIISSFTAQQIVEGGKLAKHVTYVTCKNCHGNFRSPIQFGDQKAFETSRLINNKVLCPLCHQWTTLNKEDLLISPETRSIHLHEFMYPPMQGYDSVALKADVEIGGADQEFNMLMGRELQPKFGQKPQDIMTLSLLEGLDGIKKMSKSYGNYIGITFAANDMFGKVMSLPDNLIIKYFTLCTNLPLSEINQLAEKLKAGANPRDLKAQLAHEIVKLYHGEKAAEQAEKEFDKIFREKELPSEMPTYSIQHGIYNITELLVKTKVATSKSEAQRLIEQGAVKINGQIEKDWKKEIEVKNSLIIKVGKRKFIRINAK